MMNVKEIEKQYENLSITVDPTLKENYISYNYETHLACIFAKTDDAVERGLQELQKSWHLMPRAYE